MIEIRLATYADANDLAALRLAMYDEMASRGMDVEQGELVTFGRVVEVYNWFLDPINTAVWVAVQDGAIVAFMVVRRGAPMGYTTSTVLTVSCIYATPAARKSSATARLYRKVFALAKELRVQSVQFCVASDNQEALDLYQRYVSSDTIRPIGYIFSAELNDDGRPKLRSQFGQPAPQAGGPERRDGSN